MPKFQRRAAARPAEILDAALKCFADKGFAATTVAEIALAAGVTPGTIYRYFPSKEALVEALVDGEGELSWHRGREVAEAYGSRTAREVLALLLNRWVDHLRTPRAALLLLVMSREGAGFPAVVEKYGTQLLDSGRLALERALRHGIERGEFPVLAVEETARTLATAVLGAVAWRACFGPSRISSGDSVRQVITALVRGLPGLRDAVVSSAPAPSSAPAQIGTSSTTGTGLRIVTLVPPPASRG